MRRNDVVHFKQNGLMYGRIVRFVDPETVLWICNGRHIYLSAVSDLVVSDYKGTWEWTGCDELKTYYRWGKGDNRWSDALVKYARPARFQRMPSLRKLKQKASYYHHENAWRTPLAYEFLRRE